MELDYKKLNFKAGLEIHQQLDAGKLFCKCPSYLRKDPPDFTITRKLHKVAGETGEIDVAVEYEASLNKKLNYEGYSDTTCLVELDESPPNEINFQALEEALKIALLLNCEIFPVSQIMRKTVIDGSNTSGFQRTVLIAHDGFVDTSFGTVVIESIALEEDAARIITKDKNSATYRLDRLGIPLIEISTSPSMITPEQVKEAALKIGEILRACKVKRGIGTIRQDVNVSIKSHERVEIKGFQEPRVMTTTIQKEVQRQLSNLKDKKTNGEVRNALPSGETEFLRPLPGKARMYPETDLPLLKISRETINKIKKHLPKLKTELKDELKRKGLTDELINLLLSDYMNLDEFTILTKVYDKNAPLIAKMVTLWRQEFATKYNKLLGEVKKILHERVLESILEKVRNKTIEENDVRNVMTKIMQGKTFEEATAKEKISHDELEEEITKLVKEKPGLTANAYMGLLMQKFKGKIDAKKAMEILRKLIKL